MMVQRGFKNMNIFGRDAGFSRPRLGQADSSFLVEVGSVVRDLASEPVGASRRTSPAAGRAGAALRATKSRTIAAVGSADCAVSGFAGGADSGGSTFPEQIVEADRWVQANPDLKGEALGQAVDQQPWDPSVKALTAFPSVLGNMDKNLSWTSSLGDAYYNQQQDVMDAVQEMRQRAQVAGNLKTTPQQTVTTQGSSIVVQPADPEVVYVPAYDPWLVYGGPIMAWPGWYPYPGIWFGGPYLSFGIGLRNRLLRRFWMGLASLGIQLGWPIRNFWRRQVLLPEHHVL